MERELDRVRSSIHELRNLVGILKGRIDLLEQDMERRPNSEQLVQMVQTVNLLAKIVFSGIGVVLLTVAGALIALVVHRTGLP